jgi:hypothetical protein
MALASPKKIGIGMTSLRTRERMLTRLREQGIKDEVVLHAMGEIPRHIFVDEAHYQPALTKMFLCRLALHRPSRSLTLWRA